MCKKTVFIEYVWKDALEWLDQETCVLYGILFGAVGVFLVDYLNNFKKITQFRDE